MDWFAQPGRTRFILLWFRAFFWLCELICYSSDKLHSICSPVGARIILNSDRHSASETDIFFWNHNLGYVEEHQDSNAIIFKERCPVLFLGAAIQ